jgi:hypothetical protein
MHLDGLQSIRARPSLKGEGSSVWGSLKKFPSKGFTQNPFCQQNGGFSSLIESLSQIPLGKRGSGIKR